MNSLGPLSSARIVDPLHDGGAAAPMNGGAAGLGVGSGGIDDEPGPLGDTKLGAGASFGVGGVSEGGAIDPPPNDA